MSEARRNQLGRAAGEILYLSAYLPIIQPTVEVQSAQI